jgi:5-methylcytosine-specific restriction endonuclease McrA
MRTIHDDKAQKQRNKTRDRAHAYRLVNVRDRYRCRACGRPGVEHHHIRGRQIRNAEHSSNVILICRECHNLRHVKRVLVITGNADSRVTFENTETGKTWDG